MSYPSTIGNTTTRVIEKEGSYTITQGFPIAASFTPVANQMVRLLNDGTIQAVSASTQRPLGRVVSAWQKTDLTARVALGNVECILHAQANGTVAAADLLACTGFDATTQRPIYKTAASADYASAVAFTGATTTNDITIGILTNPILLP